MTGDAAGPVVPAPPPPTFSVIVNAYNGAAFIGAALASIAAQTWTDFECIVWDDGSTDGTVAIAQAIDDARFRVVASPANAGIGPARNGAIAAACGDWLAFLDQDDLWMPGKLAQQARLIDGGGDRLGIVYGRAVRFAAGRDLGEFDPWHPVGRQPDGDIFELLMRRPSFVALSSAVLRRSAVTALGPIPAWVVFCPDYYLILNVAHSWHAACTAAVVCRYRVHPAGMSQVYTREIHDEAFHIIAAAARHGDDRIVRHRATVRDTLIALHEIVSGDWLSGAWHLLRRGSIAYAIARAFVRRAWRPAMHGWMKR